VKKRGKVINKRESQKRIHEKKEIGISFGPIVGPKVYDEAYQYSHKI